MHQFERKYLHESLLMYNDALLEPNMVMEKLVHLAIFTLECN